MASTDENQLRIAYTYSGSDQWTGGLTYLNNLLIALQTYTPQVNVYILSDHPKSLASIGENHRYINYGDRKKPIVSLINKFTLRFLGYDLLLDQTLRSVPGEGFNLVFPGCYRAGKGRAVLYWIPDFQHLYLPEMYSQSNISALNQKFKQGIERSTLVVLSSKNAQSDFNKFASGSVHKSRVLNFVAHVPDGLYESNPMLVVEQYHLPEKFIYLPNQFWKHKNHIVVLESLRMLKARNIKPFIVCTGNPVDIRNPLHFANLMQKISEWGLRDQVAFLGLVPHDHVYMLIRQSLCVLNPSLFEGWSTTVEEAKSVGKRVILSDLPVHHEQNPPASEFFHPKNPEQLCSVLAECWDNYSPGPDLELEAQARFSVPGRMKMFAETFVSIASDAVKLAKK